MDRITSNLPRIKNVLHGLQAFCILVAGIMTIVFLVKGDHSGGAIIFYLILCFLTLPAIIYNSMTLWFARSRAWGNAYAFAILDFLYTILWLAAMASVASFNSQTVPKPGDPAPAPATPATPAPAPAADGGVPAAPAQEGEVAGKVETATRLMVRGLEMWMNMKRADTPAEATADAPKDEPAMQGKCDPACGVSKAMVGFAFFIFLFFALTTAISIQNALYYRTHGSMPLSNQRITGPQSIDPDRDAFSTAPHDLYAPLGGGRDDDDEEAGRYGGGDGAFQSHRRASDDLYSGGAPMEGGRYGLPSYHNEEVKGDGDGDHDHLGRFEHEMRPGSGLGGRQSAMDGRGSAMGGKASAMGGVGGMPYGPDSYQDTSYGGASTAYVSPRVEEEMGGGGRVQFPAAPYGA